MLLKEEDMKNNGENEQREERKIKSDSQVTSLCDRIESGAYPILSLFPIPKTYREQNGNGRFGEGRKDERNGEGDGLR